MMSYVDSILEPGEHIRYRTTVSSTVYFPALLLAVFAFGFLIVGANHRDTEEFFWFLTIVSAIAAIGAFIPAWFRRLTTEIAVTDRRIILKRGRPPVQLRQCHNPGHWKQFCDSPLDRFSAETADFRDRRLIN